MIASIAAPSAGSPVIAPLVAPVVEGRPAAGDPAPGAPEPAVTLHSNPVSSLDPALAIVVLDFYNDAGEVTQSIPTQKQLELYRLHEAAIGDGGG